MSEALSLWLESPRLSGNVGTKKDIEFRGKLGLEIASSWGSKGHLVSSDGTGFQIRLSFIVEWTLERSRWKCLGDVGGKRGWLKSKDQLG